MTMNRRGETRPILFRIGWLFEINGGGYPAVCGELAKGPCENKRQAVAERVQLLRRAAMFGHAIWH